jgi:hypothetical protein
MTLTRHARLAGFAYIFYVGAGISSMLVPAESRGFFNIFESFSALVLGWTLYVITREVDADLALLAMMCRVIEAVPGRGEIYFAVGSTIFCWLLLRGQMIPLALAWLGTATSAMLVILLLGQAVLGITTNWSSPVTWFVWLPVLIFEMTFAVFLLTKGVARPISRSVALGTG